MASDLTLDDLARVGLAAQLRIEATDANARAYPVTDEERRFARAVAARIADWLDSHDEIDLGWKGREAARLLATRLRRLTGGAHV